MSDSQLKETQPLADTSDKQDTAPVNSASADPLSMCLDRLLSARKQGRMSQPVHDPDKLMDGPDLTRTVQEPPGSREPVFPQQFLSRTIELMRQALHDLWCDGCHWCGHKSADCPWQAQWTCIFCGSPRHTGLPGQDPGQQVQAFRRWPAFIHLEACGRQRWRGGVVNFEGLPGLCKI